MVVWILLLAMILLVLLFLQRREHFATGSITPTCPDGLILVGKKCRMDGVDKVDGQCPEGTTMNEEGMCQRQEDPICPADYTLRFDDFNAMCEPNTPVQEPSDLSLIHI